MTTPSPTRAAALAQFPDLGDHWKTWATKKVSLNHEEYETIRQALTPQPQIDVEGEGEYQKLESYVHKWLAKLSPETCDFEQAFKHIEDVRGELLAALQAMLITFQRYIDQADEGSVEEHVGKQARHAIAAAQKPGGGDE